jgi:hypothetical protein
MRLKVDTDNRLHALLCAVLFLLCALLTRPYVEMGVSDDFSFIRSAQVLAQTGHIVYNGWASMPLGWLLYLGALFIKLFGFSFTAVRASMIVLSMVTTYLLHRVMVGFGLHAWNATLGTLTVVLSPVWLMLEVNFMSDLPGLFCIVLCLYLCQRAVVVRDDLSALHWLWFAGISNIVLGTVRQTGWLGVLVIVPATAWRLRRRKSMLASGLILWVIGIASVLAVLHWYLLQPYSVPEKLLNVPLGREVFLTVGEMILRMFFSALLMALPVMMLFPLALRDLARGKRTLAITIIGLAIAVLLGIMHAESRNGPAPELFFPPWIGDNVTKASIKQAAEIIGNFTIVLHRRYQIWLTIGVLVSGLSCIAHLALARRKETVAEEDRSMEITWKATRVLLLPFAAAYFLLLLPRATIGMVFDRYLTPLVMVFVIFLLRYVQEQVASRHHWLSTATLLVFSSFAVAGTHDMFAFARARVQVATEVTQSGVPRTSVEGGFEYDGWTQILAMGHTTDPALLTQAPGFKRDPCRNFFYPIAPAVVPDYVLSFDPTTCYPPSKFPPVTYYAWLPPHSRKVYVQQVH